MHRHAIGRRKPSILYDLLLIDRLEKKYTEIKDTAFADLNAA